MMKLTITLLTIAILHVSAASFAQKITLSAPNQTLVSALESIRQQSGYALFYDKTLVRQAGNVSATFKELSLDQAMTAVLKDKALTYVIIDQTIVIKQKAAPAPEKIRKAAPPTDIIGRVTNEQNQPLNGATVTNKRTQTGTLTDANGNFTTRNVLPSDTLIVSYLGYARAFIPVGDQTSLKVVLKIATNQLDQVVIQAYGETSQRLTTGDIGKVTAADIAKQPVMNVLQALQGEVAGTQVAQTDGYASSGIKVEIRGRNSINPNIASDPLYIIDGVPLTVLDAAATTTYARGSQGFIQSGLAPPANGQSPFFSINPSDVESIEVLKDADATAIYGSRAANGVILITTKKGKAGKAKFDFNLYQGLDKVTNHYDMLNTQQYAEMREEALKNDGQPLNIYSAPDLLEWGTTRYTDWQKALWGRIGKTTDAQSSLSGGDAQTTYRIGAGYRRQTEILAKYGDNQRASLSINLNHKSLNQRLSISLTADYTYVSIDEIYLPNAASLPPNAPAIYDNQGNLNYAGYGSLNGLYPFQGLLQPYNAATNFLNSSFLLSYNLLKGLIIKTTLGYNNVQGSQTNSAPISSQNPSYDPTGTSVFAYTNIHNLVAEPQIEYNGFISKGKLNLLAGYSGQKNLTDGHAQFGYGYSNDALLGSINNAPSVYTSDNQAQYKYAAIFGRINYNWEDKYIINLNARRDGSSRFGPGRQFGNFGSIGAAWIFSEEPFIKNNFPFISFGKFRGSYGTTGSDNIGDYSYLARWQSNANSKYNGNISVTPISHSDSLLHWEVNRKLEFAFNISFFKDKLNFEASWYRNRCSDQLVAFPTPEFTGFTLVTTNSPANVQNSGIELNLNAKIIDRENIKWSAKFNIAFNRNKLLSYPNISQSPYSNIYVVGKPLNIAKLLHYTGVDPETGQYTFQDINHDGQISVDYSGKTPDDRYVVDLTPKYFGGFSNSFNYKNVELSLFFYFIKQTTPNALASINIPGGISNEPVDVLNRWQKPGDIASVAKFTTQPSIAQYDFQQVSDGVYTDGAYIRLKNLSLAYTFPKQTTRKLGVDNLRIYVQGENLLLFTKYNGLDPEVPFGSLPPSKILTLGLSCNF